VAARRHDLRQHDEGPADLQERRQIATATGAGNPQSDATGNFLIGNNAAGSATFNGLIDDVLVTAVR